jgi:RNA polymerase sigma-B factor
MTVVARERRSQAWLLREYHHRGDRHAREELVRSLMPLVHDVVGRYHHPRFEADLFQAACCGLARAIERWDETRGRELSAYAIPSMHGEIRKWLRDNAWAVHVPRSLKERVLATTRAESELFAMDGRSPTPQRIADHLGISLEDTLDALQAGDGYATSSLDAPVGEPGQDLTLSEAVGTEDGRLERIEELAALRSFRGVLREQELVILGLRFIRGLTQSQIALQVGCSQMQVSRVLRRSLDRLRTTAAESNCLDARC